MNRKRRAAPVWVPLQVSVQEGRKVVLTGHAAAQLSEQITAPRLDVKGRGRETIGRLRSITNDQGALTAVFYLNPLDEPVLSVSGRFLLGLVRRGPHTAMSLYQVDNAVKAPPSGYPGMLGEDL